MIMLVKMASHNNINTVECSRVHHRLSVCSYNCRGFNFVKREYINRLLVNCDILFMQEHWLSEAQLSELGHINNRFLCHAVCGFDNADVLSGRPYGGCAIFWRADSSARVDIVETGSTRICAVIVCTSEFKILFISVYMPYEDSGERADDFSFQLSLIDYTITQNLDCHVVLGDFNVDFSRSRLHTGLLNDFYENADLEPTIRHNCCNIDYSYNFNMDRFSVLDHFVLSGVLFDSALPLSQQVTMVIICLIMILLL